MRSGRSAPPPRARCARRCCVRASRPSGSATLSDDAGQTLHVGACAGDELAGVATLALEPPPGGDDPRAWRLRGMAVSPDQQGCGLGRLLIAACVAHARRQRGSQIWCLGRTSAAPFYRALGFALLGAEFDLPESGPHYVMQLLLPAPPAEPDL